jgi:hypothetical protein
MLILQVPRLFGTVTPISIEANKRRRPTAEIRVRRHTAPHSLQGLIRTAHDKV